MTSRIENPPPTPRLHARNSSVLRVARRGRLDRPQVRVGEILDMDVVADARAVRRGVVVAEHGQRLAALGRREDVGDEVGLGVVVLAELVRGTGDVEVAQAHAADARRRGRTSVSAASNVRFVSPYGLIGRRGASSGIGVTSGVP